MLLFRRRLLADFLQMLALSVGVLVMTAILAGTPMYQSVIESLGASVAVFALFLLLSIRRLRRMDVP